MISNPADGVHALLTGSPDVSQGSCMSGGLRGEVCLWICTTTHVAVHSSYEQPTR